MSKREVQPDLKAPANGSEREFRLFQVKHPADRERTYLILAQSPYEAWSCLCDALVRKPGIQNAYVSPHLGVVTDEEGNTWPPPRTAISREAAPKIPVVATAKA